MARDRMELLEQIDLHAVARISEKAWREARSAHAKLKRLPIDRDTDEPAMYRLDVRTKQKVLLDYLLNLSQSPESQRGMTQWAIENPGDFLKLMGSMMPKEISVSGEVLHGVMVVPSREKDLGSWLERMEEQKEPPFVLDEVNWKTSPHDVTPIIEDEKPAKRKPGRPKKVA